MPSVIRGMLPTKYYFVSLTWHTIWKKTLVVILLGFTLGKLKIFVLYICLPCNKKCMWQGLGGYYFIIFDTRVKYMENISWRLPVTFRSKNMLYFWKLLGSHQLVYDVYYIYVTWNKNDTWSRLDMIQTCLGNETRRK